jgi:hypothetical protein
MNPIHPSRKAGMPLTLAVLAVISIGYSRGSYASYTETKLISDVLGSLSTPIPI